MIIIFHDDTKYRSWHIITQLIIVMSIIMIMSYSFLSLVSYDVMLRTENLRNLVMFVVAHMDTFPRFTEYVSRFDSLGIYRLFGLFN